MAGTILQYQSTKLGGPLAIAAVPKPTPESSEVCIRIKAVALNPLDWKMLSRGEMVQDWPFTFGLDGAGIVEAVGDGVTDFCPGDEVFSLCGIGGKTAGFQEIVTVPQHFVARKPSSFSFEEVASLPICFLTASAAILCGLKVRLPQIRVDPRSSNAGPQKPGSVLVLGGGSAVGGAAVQLLRGALPDAKILATASPKHADRLSALGATQTIDRSSPTLVSDVSASVAGGVDAIVDCVTGAADASVFGALRKDGPLLYSQVFTGSNVDVPEGVQATVVFGRQVFGCPGGLQAMSNLGQLLGEKYKLPVPVEIIGKGWESIDKGLERMGAGVSGQKLVVTI